jgi:hypothetical protein
LTPDKDDAEGVLLDTRYQLKACELAGVAPICTSLNGRDPVLYILGANGNRRHMTKSQKTITA